MHEMDVKAFQLPHTPRLLLTMRECPPYGFSDSFSLQLEKMPQNQKGMLLLKKF